DVRVREAVLLQHADDLLRRGVKSARAAHAVMAREAFHVALGRLAGDFGGDGGDVLFGEEGERIGGGARREKRDGKENFEFRISNEKMRIELCWPILHSQFFIRNSKFTSGKAPPPNAVRSPGR